MKIALIIGHKKYSPGAVNENRKISEYRFNEKLVGLVEERLDEFTDILSLKFYRRTLSQLPDDVNQAEMDFAISFHCNAFNTEVSGTETLFYHSSQKGRQCATIMQNKLVKYLGLPDRGIKPITSQLPGGYLLKNTSMPCILVEPFFIDNDFDLEQATFNLDFLADNFLNAIVEIDKGVF